MTEIALPLIIRVSSLPGFPDCPRRWAASALRREIKAAGYELRSRTNGIGAAVGTSVHFAGKVSLDEKLTKGTLPPASVAIDAAMETLREETARGLEYDNRLTPNRNTAEIQVARMSLSYHRYVAPQINPIAVEKRLEADVPGTRQALVLSGQADVVAVEPDDINELKSGGKLGNFNAQAGGYSGLTRSVGINVTGANLDWVPRISVRREQPRPTRVQLDIALCEQMAVDTLHNIDRDLTTWREGDDLRGLLPGDPRAFRANPSSYLCGEKYCSAHSCGPNGFCLEWKTRS
jgi:hypothetical protein